MKRNIEILIYFLGGVLLFVSLFIPPDALVANLIYQWF